MNDILLTPIRLNELEILIESSVLRAVKKSEALTYDGQTVENPLNIDELEKLTGYSKPTLYGYCQKNTIPYHKKNGRLFFFKSEIILWIKEGKQSTLKDIEAEADACLSNKKTSLTNKKGQS
jgi:predicted DNA-binding transcriptional regulator AlpA